VVSIRRTNTAYSTTASNNRKSKMTRIYTFVNQKGRVGKTTTINIGAYLARLVARVGLDGIPTRQEIESCLVEVLS
jgi:hypothetical protein